MAAPAQHTDVDQRIAVCTSTHPCTARNSMLAVLPMSLPSVGQVALQAPLHFPNCSAPPQRTTLLGLLRSRCSTCNTQLHRCACSKTVARLQHTIAFNPCVESETQPARECAHARDTKMLTAQSGWLGSRESGKCRERLAG